MQIKFTTWNINTNPHSERKNARISHPQWRSKKREKDILKQLPNSDIIHIQEAANYINQYGEEIDSAISLTKFLNGKGYKVISQLLKPLDPTSYQYLTAYKTDRFDLIESKILLCTKTPNQLKNSVSEKEKLDHNYNELFEKSILITHLIDKSNGKNIWTLNLQLGYSLTHRKQVSKMILNFTNNLDEDLEIIIAGDFNSFSDWGGEEQIAILANSRKLKEVSTDLTLPNGELMPTNTTFFAYPFDCITDQKNIKSIISNSTNKQEIDQLFAQHCQATGGHLDHIFVSNNLYKMSEAILNVAPLFFPEPNNYTESGIKDYILKHLEGPCFASDHQPITVLLGTSDHQEL